MNMPGTTPEGQQPANAHMQVDLRQAIVALAQALSLVGIDEHQHGERVAYVAVNVARQLGWDEAAISDLFLASLLHDCGVSSSRMHKSLTSAMDWDGAILHCVMGEYYIGQFRPLQHLALLIRHHHTHWEDLGGYHLPKHSALATNLIYLADRVDVLRAQQLAQGKRSPQELASTIVETLRVHSPSHFAPELVESFAQLAGNEVFWYTLEPLQLSEFIQDVERERAAQLFNFEDIYQLAQIFARIVDAKSDFTYNHSVGVARLSRYLSKLSGLLPYQSDLIEIAALLHDLGKLGVPDEILDKPAPLTSKEAEIMHRHSYETFRILRHIKGFDAIAEWAGNHHETLIGNGYPFRHQNSELSREARIIAVADIFQALIQDRPYRKGMTPERSLELLKQMASDGRVDKEVVTLVEEHLDNCWQCANASADDWSLLHLT